MLIKSQLIMLLPIQFNIQYLVLLHKRAEIWDWCWLMWPSG